MLFKSQRHPHRTWTSQRRTAGASCISEGRWLLAVCLVPAGGLAAKRVEMKVSNASLSAE